MNKNKPDAYKVECRHCKMVIPTSGVLLARKLRRFHLQFCPADMGLEVGTNVVIIRTFDGQMMQDKPAFKGERSEP